MLAMATLRARGVALSALRRIEPVKLPELWASDTFSRPEVSLSVTVRFPSVVGTVMVGLVTRGRLNLAVAVAVPSRTVAVNEPTTDRLKSMRPTMSPSESLSSPLQRVGAAWGVPAMTVTVPTASSYSSLTV
jgi:hypothetical protein